MTSTLRLVVLASGGGTNFQALVDQLHEDPGSGVRIVRLLASRPGIGALERAERAGIPAAAFPAQEHAEGAESDRRRAEEEWLLRELSGARPGLVVLAGYLRMIPESVVDRYRGRMMNIHPALLPSFGGKGMYGMNVHRAVAERGVRVTGVTVHFVNEEYDRGAIIAQWPVPVRGGDGPEAIAERVLEVEHRILPAVVLAYSRGELRLTTEGRAEWSEDWFGGDRFCMAAGARPPAATGGVRYMDEMED